MNKKISQAIKLIQQAGSDTVPEIAYSGGKDSDVILELARMSGIKYRAIYRNTTIDPPGTIAHVKENNVEIIRPKLTFFQLIEINGIPNRFRRFCCRYLKEYKVLDRCIMGIRKSESIKRAKKYNEPTECRFYSKHEHVEAIYPILNWTNQEIVDFIKERGIKIHPLYYQKDGNIDPTRRLGCMCCPMAYYKKRIEQFQKHPNMVKAYIRAGQIYRDTHPGVRTSTNYTTIYQQFIREVFFESHKKYENYISGMFEEIDYKKYLSEFFNIDLP